MDSEVKILGEIIQCHKCMEVCHKYGNKEQCHFQFPHDIEPKSYFDPNTNSVVLKCLDSMISYFNKYILVFCRHNHDIKSILSGKAAMFYITDYITKLDVKTYDVYPSCQEPLQKCQRVQLEPLRIVLKCCFTSVLLSLQDNNKFMPSKLLDTCVVLMIP